MFSLLSSFHVQAEAWHEEQGFRYRELAVPAQGHAGFTRLNPADLGITFTNLLTPEHDMNNQNLINGSGVALGDVDGDGWCDIFLCSLDGPNKLYRNLGNWKFEDITDAAGLTCVGQLARGATFADVDGNGTLDLIVTFSGGGARLYLNDGKGHFQEDLNAGLRARTGSTSVALADLDGDGSLDLYVANYGENSILRSGGQIATAFVNGKEVVTGRYANRLKIINGKITEFGEPDALYLNDGHGHFKAVSWTDGRFLDEDGRPLRGALWDFGLTVQMRDLNGDGIPDIYVCNDFATPDRFWLNDGTGHFRAVPRLALRHQSFASMGVDFADVDRDGKLDIFVVEMLGRTHAVRMQQMSPVEPAYPVIGQIEDRPEIPRNTLFWNRGDGTYAEIAPFGGLAASDWSWCPIFMDVDLDGYEDLLISNGHLHDVNNLDLNAAREQRGAPTSKQTFFSYPPLAPPKAAFRNRGDLTFEDVSRAWGFNATEVAHGMAAADLDNDGDLDLVLNCLNGPPLIYRNEASAPRLAVRLKGRSPNTQGIGAKITVRGGPVVQSQEIVCGGRYLSGDDPMRVFATGKATNLTIEVVWRNGSRSTIPSAQPNRLYEISEEGAQPKPAPQTTVPAPLFRELAPALAHVHREEAFDDFARQPLLPNRLSQCGPGVAWFDLNGDGHEDLIISAGRGGAAAIFLNDGHGHFQQFAEGSITNVCATEQTTALGWAIKPGQTALLIGSSSYEDASTNRDAVMQFNFRSNQLQLAKGLPNFGASPGAMAMADIDGDGNLDLFVAGRVVPGRYPVAADCNIYRGTDGRFELDRDNSKVLQGIGLVTGAVFSDLDGDGFPELILATEWGPLRVFHNDHGHFREATRELGLAGWTGWWSGVTTADVDGDGRMDIVAGNWGLNSPYRASAEHPARLYYGDLNGLGTPDLIEAFDDPDSGKIVPRRDWKTLRAALPFLTDRFATFKAFANASVQELLGERMKEMQSLTARTFESAVFLNRGDHFERRPLPREAQFSPVFAVCAGDFNGDGHEDLFLSQNFFACQLGVARQDAGRGLLLLGDGAGNFRAAPGQESGLKIYGEQRGAAAADFNEDGRLDLAVAQNGNATVVLENIGAKPGLRVRLQGPLGNSLGIGAVLRVRSGEKPGAAREIHSGSGYWSQDSAVEVLAVPGPGAQLEVRWPGGGKTVTPIPADAAEIRVDQTGKATVVR